MNRKLRKDIKGALANRHLRTALDNFARTYPEARENAYRGIDFESLREDIKEIKTGAIDDFRELADGFEQKLKGHGVSVYRASDGETVAHIISEIARKRNAKLAVKSKSMATEEIHLNDRLKDILRVVETDLGEWLIQQLDERPSHMVMPAIHLTREKCAGIFSKHLGTPVEPDIPRMVKLARGILRKEFLRAEIGISGCNIAAVDTGTMVILTNEGNARLASSLPPVHIVLMGYEKLVPRFKDIAPLVAAIPRNATCQYISSYVTMISGPSETFETLTGNNTVSKELHVILLDNGRLEMLADPVFKQLGQCIRCASCLNVCPVYGLLGGQVYGDVYAGGIGALLTAFLHSEEAAESIQELCLSCGRCREMCPGQVDIPDLILHLRQQVREKMPPPFLQRFILRNVVPSKTRLDVSLKAAAPAMRFFRQAPSPARRFFRDDFQTIQQDISKPVGTVAFFHGCMVDYFYPGIGRAVVSLLNGAGYRVELPVSDCCGAPAFYSGMEKEAKKIAARNLEKVTDKEYDFIVTVCPTGTVMLKKYWPQSLQARTVDMIRLLHEFLKEGRLNFNGNIQEEERVVTYHYSCHLKRDSGIDSEPVELLNAVPGVRYIEMEEADRCCGFAGSYSAKLPEISNEILKRKIKNIRDSGAQVVLTDCPGCLFALRKGLKIAGSPIEVHHTAVFIASNGFRG